MIQTPESTGFYTKSMRHYQSSLRREEKTNSGATFRRRQALCELKIVVLEWRAPKTCVLILFLKKIVVKSRFLTLQMRSIILFVFSRLKSYSRKPSLRHEQHLQLINDDNSQLLSISFVFPIFLPHQRVAWKNSHSVLSPSVWARFDDALSKEGSRHEPKMKSDGKQTHKSRWRSVVTFCYVPDNATFACVGIIWSRQNFCRVKPHVHAKQEPFLLAKQFLMKLFKFSLGLT